MLDHMGIFRSSRAYSINTKLTKHAYDIVKQLTMISKESREENRYYLAKRSILIVFQPF